MLPVEPLLFVALVALLGGLIALLWKEMEWPITLPRSLDTNVTAATQSPKADADANDGDGQPVATLSYRIDDPSAPDLFNAFLDEPLLTLHGPAFRRDEPPAYTLEQAVLDLLADVEAQHAGQLHVRVDVQRGSFTLGLTFLGAYQFLAQYQDFVQSIQLLRRQIETLLQTTASHYHARTGRRARVDSDVSIKPPVTRAEASRRHAAPSSYADTDVRITVQTAPPLTGALSCGLALLIVALLALLLTAVGCTWSEVNCGEALRPFWETLLTP